MLIRNEDEAGISLLWELSKDAQIVYLDPGEVYEIGDNPPKWVVPEVPSKSGETLQRIEESVSIEFYEKSSKKPAFILQK